MDPWDNCMDHFEIIHPHQELSIIAESTVDRAAPPSIESVIPWEDAVTLLRDPQTPGATQAWRFSVPSPLIPRPNVARDYARASFTHARPLTDALLDLMHRIHADFAYVPGATDASTPVDVVLAQRKGVCQDFSHLGIACCRSMGIPARYVSGYLETIPPKGEPRLIGADASHAWFSAWVPRRGWMDLDPTNNLVPSMRHITLAWGRDFHDVSPVRGVVYGGGDHILSVSVDVQPITA